MLKDNVVVVTGGAGLIGQEFVKAIIENNFILLESEIHTLKSESATFGAFKLGDLTQKINLLCKQGNEKQAFEEARKVKTNWLTVLEQLPKQINRL